MVAFSKLNSFVENLAEGVFNLGSDMLKLALSNTLPVVTNAVLADISEISAGNGYTAGGLTVTVNSSQQVSGVYRLNIQDIVLSASGGTIGPFRYAYLYDDTPTSPADPLIGYWDNGSSVTLANGESITFDFDQTNGVLTVT